MTTDRKPRFTTFAILSFFVATLFAPSAYSFWSGQMEVATQAPGSMMVRTFAPPARRAVLVDALGEAQRTADNTRMTRRDRSEEILTRAFDGRRSNINVYVHSDEASRFDVSERAFRPELPPGVTEA